MEWADVSHPFRNGRKGWLTGNLVEAIGCDGPHRENHAQ